MSFGNDEMRYNLLYEYSQIVCGNRERLSKAVLGEDKGERKSNALYLISFILKHILCLDSRRDAVKYFEKHPEDLANLRLEALVKRGKYLTIGDIAVEDYDYAFRCVYGEMENLDDMKAWLEETNARTKKRVMSELEKLGITQM